MNPANPQSRRACFMRRVACSRVAAFYAKPSLALKAAVPRFVLNRRLFNFAFLTPHALRLTPHPR